MTDKSFSRYMESLGANRDTVDKLKREMRTAIEEYRLKEIRKERNITQVQLASNIGVSQNRISDIENGRISSLKIGTLIRYADAIGCDLELYICPREKASMQPIIKLAVT